MEATINCPHCAAALTVTNVRPQREIILLIHGIRDHATWAEKLILVLAREGDSEHGAIEVLPVRYSFFDSLRFWSPVFTRRSPIKIVTDRVRDIIIANPDAKITLICHSFGTWIISRLFREQPSLRFHRLILCGAVVERNFPWSAYTARLSAKRYPIVNECGYRDIWPTFAQVLSWSYGTSGVHGFLAEEVRNRFHETKHSDYFLGTFPEEFWRTLVWDDELKTSEFESRRPAHSLMRTYFEGLPLRWGVLAVVLLLLVVLPLFGTVYALAPGPSFSKAQQMGMRFVPIRSSHEPFLMGALKDEMEKAGSIEAIAEYIDELPQHQVRLRSFYMADSEVTCGQFFEVAGSRAHEMREMIQDRFEDSINFADERPVKGVTWLEAISFCNALSEREGIVPPFYTIREVFGLDIAQIEVRDWNADGYRLPTEAEWEFACRSGRRVTPEECDLSPSGEMQYGTRMLSRSWFAWNSSQSGNKFDPNAGVVFDKNSFAKFFAPRVRSLEPTELGLYDMQGSVWEWCWDEYDEKYYSRGELYAPRGPQPLRTKSSATHVRRGGSATSIPSDIRSTCRGPVENEVFLDKERNGGYIFTGFRVARNIPWWAMRDRKVVEESWVRVKGALRGDQR